MRFRPIQSARTKHRTIVCGFSGQCFRTEHLFYVCAISRTQPLVVASSLGIRSSRAPLRSLPRCALTAPPCVVAPLPAQHLASDRRRLARRLDFKSAPAFGHHDFASWFGFRQPSEPTSVSRAFDRSSLPRHCIFRQSPASNRIELPRCSHFGSSLARDRALPGLRRCISGIHSPRAPPGVGPL